ncbi:hypothetical protein FACS189467_0940 [Bacteroidia bacterium]|nr:hypothetical protein FACS189467_0940 [Bacteroidia bacterium]
MLSMFYGLLVRMYYAPKEHNPPHIHVVYQEKEATVNILNGSMINGKLSRRHLRLVQAWIEIHREDLLADWQLCQNGEEPRPINPLI